MDAYRKIDANNWTQIRDIYIKSSASVWSPVKRSWYKNDSGIWVEAYAGIPKNMVILYHNVGYDGFQADGNSGITNNLCGLYPMSASTGVLGLGGNASHTGESHGAHPGSTTASWGPSVEGQWVLFGTSFNEYASGHTHTTGTHYHTTAASNNPVSYNLIPTMYNSFIYSGAVFLSATATFGDANWQALTQAYATANTYLRFMDYGGYVGYTADTGTHNHGAANMVYNSTSLTPNSSWKGYTSNPTNVYATHSHGSISHNASTISIDDYLPSYSLKPWLYSGSPIYNISKLPINTLAFFTSPEMPAGWQGYYVAEGQLIKLSATAGTSKNAATHSHSLSITYAGAPTPLRGSVGWSTGHNQACTTNHTYHAVTDSHATAVSAIPPYVKLFMGQKIIGTI